MNVMTYAYPNLPKSMLEENPTWFLPDISTEATLDKSCYSNPWIQPEIRQQDTISLRCYMVQ